MNRVCITFACALFACAACEPEPEPAPKVVSWPEDSARAQGAERGASRELVATAPGARADEPGEPDVAGWAQREGAADRRVALVDVALYGGRAEAQREVRVVLRFDGVAVYRRGELPEGGGLPRRLVLDLDRVSIGEGVPPVLQVGRGGLDRIRAFALDEDRVRVSFDVQPSAAYRLFFLSDPFRIVMDFRRDGNVSGGPGRPVTVVLDPGHGGEHPGAKGPNGLREANVALALARRVRRSLSRQSPALRVVMTRDEDRTVSLEERAAIANAVEADLFVSIHLNASHDANDEGGVATFVLDTTNDQAALRLAARENDMDIERVTQLQFILASLYRRDQVQRSRALAEDVQRSTLRSARTLLPDLNDRGVKSALFYVLVGAQMPAILVEASFITSPREAQALATDGYRQALADGIAEGILRYLARASAR